MSNRNLHRRAARFASHRPSRRRGRLSTRPSSPVAQFESLERRDLLDSTVVFSELMYHPRGGEESEWIELQSLMAVDMDLSRWRLDGVDYTFPDATVLPAGQMLVVAKSPEALTQQTGLTGVLGPYAGQLSNAGESLRLMTPSERVMDELSYGDAAPWPVGPDGSGATLAKRQPNGGTADAENWTASRQLGGTPGRPNESPETTDLSAVALVFSELTAGGVSAGKIELLNRGDTPLDLSTYAVGKSDTQVAATRLPSATLSPAGRRVVAADELGFEFQVGERIFLYASDQLIDSALVTETAQVRPHADQPEWLVPDRRTLGEANVVTLESDIVFNEIMYHAPGFAATPAQPATYEQQSLVSLDTDTQWRYRAVSDGLPNDWATVAHAAGANGWLSGAAPIGYDRDSLPDDLRTQLTSPALVFPPIRTYYFEHDFELSAEQTVAAGQLLLSYLIDDGAAFYLNGLEVHRDNLPSGELSSATLASSAVNNAVWSDTVLLPKTALRVGANRISVEVHQDSVASADVVFGLRLSLGTELTSALPGTPYRESDEEWLELHNRSVSRTIDLSGWRIAGGIDFAFAAGMQLGPQKYLVVARDPVAFAAQYPGAPPVLGPFAGTLANRGERLRLLDARGNPADEVEYFDGGRWPERADGGGASLELRDPWADNRSPEVWAASDLPQLPNWQTIRYRGVAEADGTTNGTTSLYHELILGLLDAGQVLIDDVSLIENPSGAASQRLQNGTFATDELGAAPANWRLGGNHHGWVVADPYDPTNRVLRLEASGPLEDRLNHAETTLADLAKIVIGREYEISFRALWLGGSNQITSRLFFNRVARTHALTRPNQFGTPGAANSQTVSNVGPNFTGLRHEPVVPDAGQPVTVHIQAADPQGIAELTLWYGLQGLNWQSVSMTQAADGTYSATIPGHAAAETVQFYVVGRDLAGAESSFPAEGQSSRALYRVQDNRASSRGLHNFRIVMTRTDSTRLHTPTNQLSNDLLGATVIYNEREVFYDVGVRLKGSNAGRGNNTYLGFHVKFDPMQLFRGVHDSVAIDRSGRSGPTPTTQDEILIKHIANHAGGIPTMYDDLVQVLAPNVALNRPALLMMARYGDDYLDSQYADGSQGTLFRLDIAYVQRSTVGGNPENLKLPNPYEHPSPTMDLEDLGDDPERYRTHLLIRNNRAADDYSRIIAAAKALDTPGTAQVDAAAAVLDLDQWARVFALQSLSGAADVYTRGGLHHNIEFYVRPSDDKVLAFPWDWDFAFTAASNQALIGRDSNTGRLLNTPGVRRMVYGHLLDLIQSTFNNDYLDRWIDHYGAVAGQNLRPIKSYVASRSTYVLSRLPTEIPYAISTNEGQPFTVNERTVLLQGRGWINVHSMRLAGTASPLTVRWLDDERWEVRLPLQIGENQLELQAIDFDGQVVGMAGIRVTSTVPNPMVESLRLTELNYHPPDPTPTELAQAPASSANDFEFLEWQNVGATALDLTQVRLTDGVAFVFPQTVLAPGEVGVLVRNESAFRLRYGAAPRVLGEYQGSLANEGERVRLETPDGESIVDFEYRDVAPWPLAADGDGATLELRQPTATPPADYGRPEAWRASLLINGSPGEVVTNSGDVNSDGQLDVSDVDAVCSGIVAGDLRFDFNEDELLDLADMRIMIESIVDTRWGDANLDYLFNSSDLVQVFQRGEYEDALPRNSTWSDGDWNCDGEFTSADFVLALQQGSYSSAARPGRPPLDLG